MRLLRTASFVLTAAVLTTTAGAAQLKIATLAPDGSSWLKAVRAGADEIEQRTEGRVELRIYPGGSMGNEAAVLRKMRIGQLHGAVVTAGTLASVYPDIEVYTLPVLFRSYDEVDYVRSRLDDTLVGNLESHGMVSFGLIEGGFAYLMSSRPLGSFSALKGLKAWIPEGDTVAESIMQEAGLAPIPLPLSDVLTGLQTGLIDTVAGPPVGAVALQWFTKVKYLAEMPIVYTYGSIILSDKAFARLSAGDQTVVREVFGRISEEMDSSTREDNLGARRALAKQGIEFVNLSEQDEREWFQVAEAARKRLVAQEYVSPEILGQVDKLLAELRAGS